MTIKADKAFIDRFDSQSDLESKLLLCLKEKLGEDNPVEVINDTIVLSITDLYSFKLNGYFVDESELEIIAAAIKTVVVETYSGKNIIKI